MKLIVCALALAASSFAAGPLIIGGRAGTALTDPTGSAFNSFGGNSIGHNYTVGPTLGVKLPLGFSVQGDALYNRRSLGIGLGGFGVSTYSDWWEFPVMARFTPGHGPIAPTFGAGVSVQHISNFGDVPSYLLTGRTDANSVGFVAGAGVQFRIGGMQITPELRYTRWNAGSWTQSLVNTVIGNQNQAQFLVGFTF